VSDRFELLSRSPDQTLALGRVMGELLRPGDFVALKGALGTGKTHLVKGLALGLGVPDEEPVISPTFVLVREYVGRLKLYHLDAYRLGRASELAGLGLEEMREQPEVVVALEWADRVPEAVPPDALEVWLYHLAPAGFPDSEGVLAGEAPSSELTQGVRPEEQGQARLVRLVVPDAERAAELARRLARLGIWPAGKAPQRWPSDAGQPGLDGRNPAVDRQPG